MMLSQENIPLMKEEFFNKTLGENKIELFTLQSELIKVQITNYGAKVVSLFAPDRNGQFDDLVLGFDNIDAYLTTDEVYFGALIGRYANRIKNGEFNIEGKSYQLEIPPGSECIHGGAKGFHSIVWKAEQLSCREVRFSHISNNGEGGYPGNVEIEVLYSLTDRGGFKMDIKARSDEKTPLNFTQHSYFNLNGMDGAGNIDDHEIKINSDRILSIDSAMIPDGNYIPVEDTPFDFRTEKPIIDGINSDHRLMKIGNGYDHSWCIDNKYRNVIEVATVFSPRSGRKMTVYSNEPNLQFYSGNYLNNVKGKRGKTYPFRAALCLETQQYPDAPNHDHFPNSIYGPKELYNSICEYVFEVEKNKNSNTLM